MALSPQKIGIHKSFNSFNSGQLEDTFGVEKWEEKGGVNLSEVLVFVRVVVTDLVCRLQDVHGGHVHQEVHEGHLVGHVSE